MIEQEAFFCCICNQKVNNFHPYRGGVRSLPPMMELLDMVGSDVDNFSCPNCGAHDRERHLFLYLTELKLWSSFSDTKILHFAPEQWISKLIEERSPSEYIKADLFPQSEDIKKVDLLDIPYLNNSFDVVIANHVLEHVSDDKKAIEEIFRITKKGGLVILQTPYSDKLENTFSDEGISDDLTRLQFYGQEDHVRLFGKDIFNRIEQAGFKSLVTTHEQTLPEYSTKKYGVNNKEPFFLFQSPSVEKKYSVMLSVCIITYQHHKYIKQCIESIVSQKTNFQFEIIIGDDGSEDGTIEICKEFEDQYPELIKLTVYDRTKNRERYTGCPGTYNFLQTLAQASGKYIALCEGDDYWLDNTKLQQQVDFLEGNPDFTICCHSVFIDNGQGLVNDTITSVEKSESTLIDLAKGNYIHTPSVVYRNVFPQQFPDFFYTAPVLDYLLHIYVAERGKIKHIDKKMAAYRVHSDSYWSSKSDVDRMFLWLDVLVPLVGYFSFNIEVFATFRKQLFDCGYILIEVLYSSGNNQTKLQKILSIFKKTDAIKLEETSENTSSLMSDTALVENTRIGESRSQESSKKIAVILHLYYLYLWDEFELALVGIPQEFDLYISIPEGKAKNISAEILKAFPDAKIYEFADKGRDILPFLTIFKEIQPLNYQLILKLHTKKSPHLKGYKGVDDFGGKWRKTTLSSLAQWNKRVNDIFDLFDSNPTLGVFSPFGYLYQFNSADANFQMINQIMPGIDEETFNKKQFMYAAGSMFWFRPEAIEKILELNLTADNFEQESGQVDGTLAHAIERLFGVICQTSGYILTDRMPKRDDIAYQGWLEQKREYDLAHDLLFLSDNLTKSSIHFFVYVDNEDLSMLANTIDSMGSQTYENWHLSVISSFSCPDEMFNDVAQLSWLQVEQQFEVQALLLKIGINTDWIGFLEVGDYLEPHALSCCVEYLNKNPQWQVVYTDEDRVSPEGFFHSPRFKPGFNLDLLYSTDYMGGLALFRAEFKTDASSQLKNLNYPNPFANYELILHYLECFGESVIGHIESILLHRQEGIDQFFISQIEFRKTALANHFKAKKIDCSIDKGLVDGSFFINYQLKDEPKVSIIIPTKDQLPLLKACVESIAEKTNYSNYEVIIIDNQSEKAETKNYFAEIQKSENKISVIEYQKPYNYSAINNFAVEQATGDYLVLLNNDTMVLQEQWLQGMLSHVQRKEVGVVGVKLVFPNKTVQHAGVVIGMGGNGIAEHPHIGISMDGVGYMDRAMLTQEYSAVTAACLMIEKKLYQQVGGLDEEKFKILYNDVDLCLKVKELGFKVVWTPHVTLIHHGSSSLKKLKQDNKKLEQSQQEADNMLEKWLPQLANDAAYNRNLSLKTTDFQVDTSMNVTWNVDFKDKPRIYAFPLDSQGVGQYRVRAPLTALTRAGKIESSLANNFDSLIFPTAVEIERIKPDVLLIQNGFLDHMLTPWKKYRKFNDAFMVCGLDDLVYMLPQQHPKQGAWPKNIRRKVKELFQHSDRVVVANDALAEEFSKMSNEIVVVPNYLENSRWDSLTLPEKRVGNKLRVGWAGGQDHISDLQFILPVVEALHKEVDWIFMGLCLEELKPFVKEIHGGIEFDLYPQKLANLNLDLAIAPLGHNKFNECKTNLRLLEYGALAWPVVCSDILPYQNAPVTRVANNVQQWIKVIREKINEPDELLKEGAILQKWVKDNYMLDKHLDAWFSALMP